MIGVATDGRENSRWREAIRFGPRALTYRELTGVATYLAGLLQSEPRVAIWAVPAGLDLDPASGRGRLSYRRAAELFRVCTGWTLHQLERYARPGPEAVARHLAETGPARRRP